jgi:hypothetical protein
VGEAIGRLRVAIARLRVAIAERRVAIAELRIAIAKLRVPAAKFPGTLLCKAPGVSTQRGEMFIASTLEKPLAPLGAKQFPPGANAIALLTELKRKKRAAWL